MLLLMIDVTDGLLASADKAGDSLWFAVKWHLGKQTEQPKIGEPKLGNYATLLCGMLTEKQSQTVQHLTVDGTKREPTPYSL